MENIIKNFVNENLNMFKLKCTYEPDDLINLYVEKTDNQYILVANINTLKKMNLTDLELECLLWHEKGHYELNHLEEKNNYFINIFLMILVGVTGISSIGLSYFHLNILWMTLAIFLLISYLITDNLLILKKMRKFEYNADKYACRHCSGKEFINMLNKLENFYRPFLEDKRNLAILSTHPPTESRINKIISYHPKIH